MFQILLLAAAAAAPSGPAACAALQEDRARLACYDSLFRPAAQPAAAPVAEAAATGNAPAPAPRSEPAAPVSSAVTAGDPEAEFGLSGQQREQRAEAAGARSVDQLSARIVAIEPSRVGKPTIELDNGQRWRQIEATSGPVFEVGETVVIRKASFGSFLAAVPDSGRAAVRVRREE